MVIALSAERYGRCWTELQERLVSWMHRAQLFAILHKSTVYGCFQTLSNIIVNKIRAYEHCYQHSAVNHYF